jgi:hypothetical protein
MRKIPTWKKRARKRLFSEDGGSIKLLDGEGKRKVDLVESEGEDGGHVSKKKSKVPSVHAQKVLATTVW